MSIASVTICVASQRVFIVVVVVVVYFVIDSTLYNDLVITVSYIAQPIISLIISSYNYHVIYYHVIPFAFFSIPILLPLFYYINFCFYNF